MYSDLSDLNLQHCACGDSDVQHDFIFLINLNQQFQRYSTNLFITMSQNTDTVSSGPAGEF